jgi:regulator of protease activity HflC (stomatin/prohibitin superfamily)/divalent metal cation (Fe/Co/Zn/Cd) transporter
MERSIKKNGLVNFLALLVIGVAGFAIARSANTLAGQVSLVFIGLGVLVAAVSWFQMRLEEQARLEKLELEELAKSHGSSALFEAKDTEVFPAERSREQFERFFVPAFTAILCLIQVGAAFFLWRWLSAPTTKPELKEPMTALALFSLFALVLFLLGRFSATFARLENQRLLRPGASYLLLNGFLCAVVALGIVGTQTEVPRADFYVAYVLCGLLALTGVETLVNLVLEIYRPRVKGKVERPLYDSRLVGLLGQPEGLITTAAQALDYQFGFKVSETWFYRLFFEKALKWVVLAQVGVLVLSTCVVFIEPGEQGLLEHFGRPVVGRSPLGPGAHLTWPAPIDKVYRRRTDQIQSFEVGLPAGAEQTADKEPEHIVLWTVAHSKVLEENFLVASRDESSPSGSEEESGKRTPPVSMLTGTIPVQYQIANLVQWEYINEDAPSLLEDVARREVVRFFAGVDMNEVMSSGRQKACQLLMERMQAAANQHELGAKIIYVSLQDLHPPVKIAKDFEDVIGAIETKEAKILTAQADDVRTNALAQAQATNILGQANAARATRVNGALAEASLFTNQIPAYEACPSVYAERDYLDTFVRATADARKYLLLTTNTHDVLIFDLQESFTRDLSTLKVASPTTKSSP